MANNPGPYNPPATGQNQFNRLGFPGRYHSALTVASGVTVNFTGSNYGYGAILIGTGSNYGRTQIHVAGGGVIAGSDLSIGTIYEITPSKVTAYNGNVYVFKRQQ